MNIPNTKVKYLDKICMVGNNGGISIKEINDYYLENGWNIMQIHSNGTGTSTTWCWIWIRKEIG